MTELINFVTVSLILVGIGIYGLIVKRNEIRIGDIQGKVFALFAIAIAAAEVAVGLAIIIIAYRLYKDIDVAQYKYLRG